MLLNYLAFPFILHHVESSYHVHVHVHVHVIVARIEECFYYLFYYMLVVIALIFACSI